MYVCVRMYVYVRVHVRMHVHYVCAPHGCTHIVDENACMHSCMRAYVCNVCVGLHTYVRLCMTMHVVSGTTIITT
jgi:hypothetical protein